MMKKSAAILAGVCMSLSAQAEGDWSIYAGVDTMQLEISVTEEIAAAGPSNLPSSRRIDADTDAMRMRVGMWLNEDFAVEAHFGLSGDDLEQPETGSLDSYSALYIVPRGQPFEWMDLLFPIGVSQVDSSLPSTNADGSERVVETSNTGVAYGMNMQIRVGEMIAGEDSFLSGLGLGAGYMVYDSANDANVRGFNLGLVFGFDF